MKEIICITCPNGCHLQVDEATLSVTGNKCPRGVEYAKNELTHPVRTLTSTVRITGAPLARVPVKSKTPIAKEKLFAVMHALDAVCLAAPVAIGDVALVNADGDGTDIVVTRALPKK